ncbi:MAG: peptidoglycan binding domain-containing protein [Lachnospiraceae bacterium]|nr:peptidoglycan binding domain-containing protein [Lachnospiraceae bacterium]
MKKNKKFLFWLIPVVAFAAFYIIGAIVSSNKFWGNTYLGEKKAGFMTVADLNNDLVSSDSITITTKDGATESIKLSDIGYKSEYSTDIQAIQKGQSPMLWLFNLAGKKTYDVQTKTTYDEEKLKSEIADIVNNLNSNAVEPANAYIDTSKSEPVIVEAVEGNKIDGDKLQNTIISDLNSGVFSVDIEQSGCYLKPTVYADNAELKSLLSTISELKDVKVTIDLTGATETIDVDTFKNWITTDGTELSFKDDLVNEYVSSLADKYNTYGTTRKFPATGIGLVSLPGTARDTYGFKLDKDATAEAIKNAIKSGESQTIEAVWDNPALTRNAANGSGDIGDTYVEIDVSRQHMWYYVDGSLYLDTDVRTGDESGRYKDAATPSGIFRILSKSTDKYFLLFQPVVHADYWMPFDWEGCGIHDASWFTTFGGELYKTNGGSHGCINTPLSIVKPMYEKMKVNTPVIVYRSAQL